MTSNEDLSPFKYWEKNLCWKFVEKQSQRVGHHNTIQENNIPEMAGPVAGKIGQNVGNKGEISIDMD